MEKHEEEIKEEEASESDSCPSCDNFELEEFKENFIQQGFYVVLVNILALLFSLFMKIMTNY